MSVRQAQREIDSAEFSEWMAYYSLEPFGERLADARCGIVASTIANSMTSGKRYKPDEFMPQTPDEARPRTSDELAAKAKAITHMMGGKVIDG